MKKRILSVFLAVLMLLNVGTILNVTSPNAVVEAETTQIDDAYIQSRLDQVWEKVGNKYMTTDGQKCNGSKCLECLDIANLSCWGFTNKIVSSQIPKHYGSEETLTLGKQCCGFANFVLWYENAKNSTDSVESYKVASGKWEKAFFDQNVWVGDVVRIDEIGHSVVVLSWNDSGVTVINCNRGYDCKVEKETISWSHWANKPVGLARGKNRVHSTTAVDPAARLSELQNFFSTHKYFTTDGKADNEDGEKSYIEDVLACDWFKQQFGTVSNSQLPVQYNSATSSGNGGIQCYGFARFAQWYLFKESNSSTVVGEYAGTTTYTKANVEANCKFGDIVRFPDVPHSVIFISADSNGMKVFDCNYNLTCNVQTHTIEWSKWTGRTIVLTRAKNSGTFNATDVTRITVPAKVQFEIPFVSSSVANTVVMTSNNTSIAKVVGTKIEGVGAGSAVITITSTETGKTDVFDVIVPDVTYNCAENWTITSDSIGPRKTNKISSDISNYAYHYQGNACRSTKGQTIYILRKEPRTDGMVWGFGCAYSDNLKQNIWGWFDLQDVELGDEQFNYSYLPAKPTATISRSGDQLTISWNKVEKATVYNIYRNGSLFKPNLTSASSTFAVGAESDTYFVEAANTGFPYYDLYPCKSVSDTLTTPEKAEDPIPDKDKPQYVVKDVTAFAGKTVDLYIEIANNPGIISLRNTITFDSDVLELVSVEDAGLLNGFTTPSEDRSSPYTLRWADAIATVNNKQNGIIVKLTFKVKENTEAGKYEIKVANVESRDKDGNKYEFLGATAYVEVVDYIVGDADGDGEISDWDAILFERYLAGWKVEDINLDALDVDGDSELSDWDAILLERYLAGWKVEF